MGMGKLTFRATLLAAILSAAGCASIPLSTMLGMSNMSPRSLAQVDPEEIRVRLSVPQGFEVDPARTRLEFSIRNPSVDHSSQLGVRVLAATEGERPGGFLEPDLAVTTYLLALTPEGRDEFRALQRVLLQAEHGTFQAGFHAKFAKRPPGAREVTFWVDLKLSDTEPFMPLLEAARVEFEGA